MNINPNLLDFERNMIYTRKRSDPIVQNTNYGVSHMNFPINYSAQNTWDNQSYNHNKKECRADLQNRYANYQALPTTQAFPLNDNTNSNFFFNNMPMNTRLNDGK